jgi:hypothetical protein
LSDPQTTSTAATEQQRRSDQIKSESKIAEYQTRHNVYGESQHTIDALH